MRSENMLSELLKRLSDKNLHEVRQLGRALGVPHSTDRLKEQLIDEIVEYAAGRKDFASLSKRGAPPKSQDYDRQLAADILQCREVFLAERLPVGTPKPPEIYVGSGEDSEYDFACGGILERDGDNWLLRTSGCREDFVSDIYVNNRLADTYNLREGDFVIGRCRRNSLDEIAGLADITTVNGLRADTLTRPEFDKLLPIYADKKLKIAGDGLTGRIIDLFAPIGAGQRVLVTAPHGCGKTRVLKDIAKGIQQNNEGVKLVIVLIDVSCEEAADFTASFSLADVFTSTFDAGVVAHIKTMRLALEYCKRQVELCKNVVLVVDDITRLARAYNSIDGKAALGLDYAAVDSVKKLLGAARNTSLGGSLTVISALCFNSGDIIEDSAYSALKEVCNAKITLSPMLSKNRIYPPIDFNETYSKLDERLLAADEMRASVELRNKETSEIFSLFRDTEDNSHLLDVIKK